MKRIALVAGGDSSEIVVSLKSAAGIRSFLGEDSYEIHNVIIEGTNWRVENNDQQFPVNKDDFSYIKDGEKITFDAAYVTIHGTPGEDGKLQGYFEMIGLPYSTCGVLAASLSFNKFVCNQYLARFGVKIAESVYVRAGHIPSVGDIIEKVGLPCFVKPNAGGSSFGVSRVKTEAELLPALDKAFSESNEVIIESFIEGTEVTNGIYKTLNKVVQLPITEVVTANEFFDFEAKYTPGMAQEITPARLSDDVTDRIKTLSSAIYDILGCKGIVRVDYIIKEKTIYLLEVNTTPGMTTTSFIPQQVAAHGLTMKDVLTDVIEDAIARHKA